MASSHPAAYLPVAIPLLLACCVVGCDSALAPGSNIGLDASDWNPLPSNQHEGRNRLSQGNCTFDSRRILAVWSHPVHNPRRPMFPAHYTATVDTRNIALFPPARDGIMSLIRSTRGRIAFDYTRKVDGRIVPSFARTGSAWAVPVSGAEPRFVDKLIYLRRGTEAIFSVNKTSCSTTDVGVGPIRRDAMYDGEFCGRYLFDVEGPGPMWVDQWYKDDHEAWVDPTNGDVVRLTAGADSHLTYYEYDYSKPSESVFNTPSQC